MLALYHGKNTFLSKQKADAAVNRIKQSLLEHTVSFDFKIIDASVAQASTIIDEIQTPPMLTPHKVLLIKRLTQNPRKEFLIETIMHELEHPGETLDLIIWEDSKLPANLKFVKALKKFKAIDESVPMNKWAFRKWAQESAQSRGLSLPADAAHLLADRMNYDPERLIHELSKLKLTGKDRLSEHDIEQLCPDTLEHSIWELIDMINSGNPEKAEHILDRILQQGNDPQFVLLMIARNVRIILLTKLLQEQGATVSDIARKIKTPPFTISSIRSNAREMSIQRLTRMYDKLSNIDYSAKTGQLDIALALNILLSVI